MGFHEDNIITLKHVIRAFHFGHGLELWSASACRLLLYFYLLGERTWTRYLFNKLWSLMGSVQCFSFCKSWCFSLVLWPERFQSLALWDCSSRIPNCSFSESNVRWISAWSLQYLQHYNSCNIIFTLVSYKWWWL